MQEEESNLRQNKRRQTDRQTDIESVLNFQLLRYRYEESLSFELVRAAFFRFFNIS